MLAHARAQTRTTDIDVGISIGDDGRDGGEVHSDDGVYEQDGHHRHNLRVHRHCHCHNHIALVIVTIAIVRIIANRALAQT